MQHTKYLSIGIVVFLIVAFAANAQTNPISLISKNTPLKEVLREIEQKSGYRILYNDEVVPDGLCVSAEAIDESAKNILKLILEETDLTFVLHSEELIIITKRQYLSEHNEIFGTVTDENAQPIPYANVVLLQANDTTRLGYGAVTDGQGYYKLANVKPANYRLQVSFIGYKTQYSEFIVAGNNQSPIVRNFTLLADETLLQELVVEGRRPALKAEDGKLIYHIPILLQNKPVTNAYDALKEIPGVMEQNEQLTLIGTSGMTVLLNGKKTSMTYDQLMAFLKSIPLSRIEDVEIMYSAPPQYNIRGAAINVILRQSAEEGMENVWQGEMAGTFIQKTYAMGNGRAGLLYLGKKMSVDVLYSYNYLKTEDNDKQTADHTLGDRVYYIGQDNYSLSYRKMHNIRLAAGRTFTDESRLDISYSGSFDHSQSDRTADIEISESNIHTTGRHYGPSQMHNFKADYTFRFGLNIGADYTRYSDNSHYSLQNDLPENSLFDTQSISSVSKQDIDRTFFYANQSHQFNNQWRINYGINYSLTHTRNISDAKLNDADYPEATFDTRQHEIIRNAFAGVSRTFSDKLSVQASLSAEFYNATEESSGQSSTIWDDHAFFPAFNISYTPAENHTLQLSLASDKSYPSYWALNPSVYYFSVYGVLYGNPHLRPSRNYDLGLTYIYKRKYVIRPYISYTADHYTQLPYQSPDKLQQEFIVQNFDFKKQIGLLTVIPFTVGKRVSSRFTTSGMYWQEKDDTFFDIPFNRKTFWVYFQLNNDIDLSSDPNLKLNISGHYTTPTAIQGIFDLGATADLSAGVTWTFSRGRARLILKGNDLLNTRTPFASIDYRGQKSSIDGFRDTRTASLSFVYRFGGYKEKEREEVDTSRFGTN